MDLELFHFLDNMTLRESQETRIALLEQHNKNIMDKFEEVFKRFDTLDERLESALNKKADVWVEKAVSWAGYTIIGSVILALLALIIELK